MKPRKCVLLFTLMLATTSVLAQMRPHPGIDRDDRAARRREFQRDFAPTHFSEDNPRERRERMTPEERQQLRRDIDDAGRELYRRPSPPERR